MFLFTPNYSDLALSHPNFTHKLYSVHILISVLTRKSLSFKIMADEKISN